MGCGSVRRAWCGVNGVGGAKNGAAPGMSRRVLDEPFDLAVVVELELHGGGAEAVDLHFALILVGDPGVDEVLAEDVALEEVGVVGLERLESMRP